MISYRAGLMPGRDVDAVKYPGEGLGSWLASIWGVVVRMVRMEGVDVSVM